MNCFNIKSKKLGYYDSNIFILECDSALICNPSLNNEDILNFFKQKAFKTIVIYLCLKDFKSGPYVNELSKRLNARIYTPLQWLSSLQFFPYHGDRAGLCGVKVPKISGDMYEHYAKNYKNVLGMKEEAGTYNFFRRKK